MFSLRAPAVALAVGVVLHVMLSVVSAVSVRLAPLDDSVGEPVTTQAALEQAVAAGAATWPLVAAVFAVLTFGWPFVRGAEQQWTIAVASRLRSLIVRAVLCAAAVIFTTFGAGVIGLAAAAAISSGSVVDALLAAILLAAQLALVQGAITLGTIGLVAGFGTAWLPLFIALFSYYGLPTLVYSVTGSQYIEPLMRFLPASLAAAALPGDGGNTWLVPPLLASGLAPMAALGTLAVAVSALLVLGIAVAQWRRGRTIKRPALRSSRVATPRRRTRRRERSPLMRVTSASFYELRTSRGVLLTLGIMAVGTLLIGSTFAADVDHAFYISPDPITGEQVSTLRVAAVFNGPGTAAVIAFCLGAIIGGRDRASSPDFAGFIATPARIRLMVGRLLPLVPAVCLTVLLGVLGTILVFDVSHGPDGTASVPWAMLDRAVWIHMSRLLLALVLTVTLGFSLAVLFRSPLAAIAIGLTTNLVIPFLVGGILAINRSDFTVAVANLLQLLPAYPTSSIVSHKPSTAVFFQAQGDGLLQLSFPFDTLLLAAWTGAAVVAAVTVLRRRVIA